MAICNLFKKIDKDTGNFLMFSQYTEDLTKSATSPGFYRVVPSKFIALNVNYNKEVLKKYEFGKTDLNIGFPLYLQNDFENGCAMMREKLNTSSTDELIKIENSTNHWSTNIFWQAIIKNIIENQDIKYIGDINIQSYNEYDGIGYSEIYCFIPNDAALEQYTLEVSGQDLIISPDSNTQFVEGYDNGLPSDINWSVKIQDENKQLPIYNYGKQINFIKTQINKREKFDFNTIIILYDVKVKDNDGNIIIYKENIPMGLYLTGTINLDGTVNNTRSKYVNNADIYDSGTSYGLRICSRFITTPESDSIQNIDIKTENASYSAFCQVMSAFGDSQAKMNEILDQFYNQKQNYNELYAIFKNGRTNVPYIKEIGDKKYWFVNGKLISEADGSGGEINVLTSGTWLQAKSLKDIKTGFKYYCKDKGIGNGLFIYYIAAKDAQDNMAKWIDGQGNLIID